MKWPSYTQCHSRQVTCIGLGYTLLCLHVVVAFLWAPDLIKAVFSQQAKYLLLWLVLETRVPIPTQGQGPMDDFGLVPISQAYITGLLWRWKGAENHIHHLELPRRKVDYKFYKFIWSICFKRLKEDGNYFESVSYGFSFDILHCSIAAAKRWARFTPSSSLSHEVFRQWVWARQLFSLTCLTGLFWGQNGWGVDHVPRLELLRGKGWCNK